MCETFIQVSSKLCVVSIFPCKIPPIGIEGTAQSLKCLRIWVKILNMPALIFRYHSFCQDESL